MSQTILVSYAPDREYEFHVSADEVANISADAARHWLHHEFDVLECAPRNPVGKILLLDVILDVAKYGGESHFAQQDDWAKTYVRNVAAAMGRPAVKVDVEALKVG